jgi:hypothetical protein
MRPLIGLWQALSMLGEPFQAGSFWTWKTVAKLIDGIPLRDEKEIEHLSPMLGSSAVAYETGTPFDTPRWSARWQGPVHERCCGMARVSYARTGADILAPASRRW